MDFGTKQLFDVWAVQLFCLLPDCCSKSPFSLLFVLVVCVLVFSPFLFFFHISTTFWCTGQSFIATVRQKLLRRAVCLTSWSTKYSVPSQRTVVRSVVVIVHTAPRFANAIGVTRLLSLITWNDHQFEHHDVIMQWNCCVSNVRMTNIFPLFSLRSFMTAPTPSPFIEPASNSQSKTFSIFLRKVWSSFP